jgi:teichuronic acid biosynthesis glycosyltransferase TuaG
MVKAVQPLVSVITPVHNSAVFLKDTIISVLNQTYQNWELILIDDNSKDDSVKIIKQFQKNDQRIKSILLDTNLGAARARNAGTLIAKGRFLAFLDADDLWVPEKLELQVNFSLDTNSRFVFGSYWFANALGKICSEQVKVPVSVNYKQSLKNHIIWTSTVLLDLKYVPREMAIMPNVRKGQDAATWWQILRSTQINAYSIQKPLAIYRRTSESLSANKFKAAKRTWYLFRTVEGLNLIKSAYNFCFYSYNAVRKRI